MYAAAQAVYAINTCGVYHEDMALRNLHIQDSAPKPRVIFYDFSTAEPIEIYKCWDANPSE